MEVDEVIHGGCVAGDLVAWDRTWGIPVFPEEEESKKGVCFSWLLLLSNSGQGGGRRMFRTRCRSPGG